MNTIITWLSQVWKRPRVQTLIAPKVTSSRRDWLLLSFSFFFLFVCAATLAWYTGERATMTPLPLVVPQQTLSLNASRFSAFENYFNGKSFEYDNIRNAAVPRDPSK